MPRPASRTRIISAAGAVVAVGALSLVLNPPTQVDPLGTLRRANAAAPPAAPPGPPAAFGVEGIDLGSLGYSGPDLEAASLDDVFAPLPSQAMVRAADVRDRIAAATPHLRGLHQAKNLLRKAADRQDHHLYAAKVAASEAEAAKVAAEEALAAAVAAVAQPPAGPPSDEATATGAALASTPVAAHDDLDEMTAEADPSDDAEREEAEVPVAGDQVAQAQEIERLAAEVAEARAVAAVQWQELEARRARRRALRDAASIAADETWRFDEHVRWLTDVLWRAQGAQRAAGDALVAAGRVGEEIAIVEVRGFRVHESIADSVRQLVDSAAAAGIDLRGKAHRPIERQIELRRQHCGPTHYDIYERPSGQCSPPTAKPGRSLHELGLALDLANGDNPIVSRRDPAYRWLAANAPSYGLHNLPAEPWHWSVTSQ
jgi:hypothetical protein